MALTAKQREALLDAQQNNGKLFQLPGSRRHSPNTLAALVEEEFLTRSQAGSVWTLTQKGREALKYIT
ncbi:TPA: hypothetical protein QDB04_002845 [Burkholderia vietnamiensis]|nr:hypothetical protein [Burkholderia vietnamiensis]